MVIRETSYMGAERGGSAREEAVVTLLQAHDLLSPMTNGVTSSRHAPICVAGNATARASILITDSRLPERLSICHVEWAIVQSGQQELQRTLRMHVIANEW